MRLTRFTDYSLRTLIYLALRPDEFGSIANIARAYRISENHLTKVVHRLGQLGLIETTRGRGGGLRLARSPETIGIGDVVRQLEDDLAIVECLGSGQCAIGGFCGLERALQEALGAFMSVLDRYTVADLLRPDAAAIARRLGVSVPRH
jgi:Rrf2 family nitric oxide-sensitive transcriptional repressor